MLMVKFIILSITGYVVMASQLLCGQTEKGLYGEMTKRPILIEYKNYKWISSEIIEFNFQSQPMPMKMKIPKISWKSGGTYGFDFHFNFIRASGKILDPSFSFGGLSSEQAMHIDRARDLMTVEEGYVWNFSYRVEMDELRDRVDSIIKDKRIFFDVRFFPQWASSPEIPGDVFGFLITLGREDQDRLWRDLYAIGTGQVSPPAPQKP